MCNCLLSGRIDLAGTSADGGDDGAAIIAGGGIYHQPYLNKVNNDGECFEVRQHQEPYALGKFITKTLERPQLNRG